MVTTIFESAIDINRIKDNPSPPISELPFLDFNVVEWVLPLAIGEFGEAHECVRFAKLYVKYKGEIQFRPSEESSPPKRDLSGLREAALHSTIVDLCDNPNLWVSTLDPQATPSSQLIYMVCYAYTPPMEHEKLEAWADTQSFMQMGGTLQLMRGKQT